MADHLTRRDLIRSGLVAVSLDGAKLSSPASTLHSARSAPRDDYGTSARQRFLLDFSWTFHLGHANDPEKDFGFGSGGQLFAKSGNFCVPGRPNFDDSAWEKIDLPHDWAVALPFHEDRVLTPHGSKPLGRNYPETSIGWYRKVFEVPGGPGKRFSLEFDGVFRDATVIFNNFYMGRNLSGYAPFSYDVTDFMNYGGKNTLVVRVDATESEGWFYEGAGIYRHVWMVVTDPVHIPQWGTYVRSWSNAGSAAVEIRAEVQNDSDFGRTCGIASTIFDRRGNFVARVDAAPQSVPAHGSIQVTLPMSVSRPLPWSIEEPHLYRAVTMVTIDGAIVDDYETRFGIRGIRFDPSHGFFLNERPIKIKGTCNHQDHAGVGSALPDRLQYYRIERLKAMGSNAYRTSHNPPTPELLDACDELGMLVMDETRMFSSTPEGLSQLERMIRRDRNHPSVIIWSLGNEEPQQGTERGARIASAMKELARGLDESRPVTIAMNAAWGKGVSNVIDVQGFNYAGSGGRGGPETGRQIDDFHRQFPNQPSIGTETASDYATRGIYESDKQKGYVSAYDVNFPSYTLSAEGWWKVYDERPFLAGGFAWTGFDYRGEPSPYGWPCISSHFGILDTCGFPKDSFYYYQAWWGTQPVLHVFPHWNWSGKEGQEIQVWVYTNLERVELFLNGHSLGAQVVEKNGHLMWNVKYEPGTLEARGFGRGNHLLTARRETTGPAAKVVMHPDRQRIRADGEDVSVIAAEVQDAQGRVVPNADHEIAFQVSGKARIIGVGNGDPSSHEADKGTKRRAFNGLCMAIVQATKEPGEVRMEASSPGLEPASVTILSEAANTRRVL